MYTCCHSYGGINMDKNPHQLPIATTHRPRKKVYIFLSIFMVSLMILGGCFGYQFIENKELMHSKKLKLSNKRSTEVNIKKDPFTVLLMGTDGRSAKTHNWRPDVLMLAAINPQTKSIKLVSIPRDTYVEIANTGGVKDKINSSAAYAYNQQIDPVHNVRETVENLLNVPVDYYAKVNFQGFMDIVDALGGVEVNNAFPFRAKEIGGNTVYFKKGSAHLDGSEALAYVRMRHDDPNGDFGRNKRQREVVQALVDKLISFNTVTRFSSIVQTVSTNFIHSFSLTEIPAIAKIYGESKNNLQTLSIKTESGRKYLGGVHVYVEKLSNKERLQISQLIQKQLNYTPKINRDIEFSYEQKNTSRD